MVTNFYEIQVLPELEAGENNGDELDLAVMSLALLTRRFEVTP